MRAPTLRDFMVAPSSEVGEKLWPFVSGTSGAAYSVAQSFRSGNHAQLSTVLIAISNLSAENETAKSKKLSEVIGLLAAMSTLATYR